MRRVLRSLLLALLLVTWLGSAWGETTPAAADPDFWFGTDAAGETTIQLYFFWTETCPHCQRARPFVARLSEELPWLEVRSVPLSEQRPDDVALFLRMTEQLATTSPAVPAFLFCGQMSVGFVGAETSGAALRQALIDCHDRVTGARMPSATPAADAKVSLPIVGPVDPETVSLPLLTVAIAAVDAFNPCAFFVLMFLMSVLAHGRRRTRMAAIGAIFIATSALLYFAFMAAWLNIFLVFGELRWVTLLAGVIALGLAAVNIKDFFWFKRGFSLSIPDSKKPLLFARMQGLLGAERWPVLVIGAVVLAVAANTYELLCTAGFPMLFTRILTLRELSAAGYYAYLALYAVIYVIPLLVIASAFVIALGSRKLQEHEGRILKLLSGLMMLALAVVLLVNPAWLSDARVAAGVLASALLATALITLLTRCAPGA